MVKLTADEQAAVLELFATFQREFGTNGLARIEEAVEILTGPETELAEQGYRRAQFFFPGLEAKPWYRTSEIPVAARLEAEWATVRAELFGVLQRHTGFQQYVHLNDYREVVPPEWKALYLKHGSATFPENRSLCPRTTALIDGDDRIEEMAMFSALNPGGHIKPHGGTWNCRLNVHLALVAPPGDCALRVGDETRPWTEGRCLIFDDSFVHEAWNRGTLTRFILLVNVWHPGLTDVEVAFLTRMSQCVRRVDVAAHLAAVEKGKADLQERRWWSGGKQGGVR